MKLSNLGAGVLWGFIEIMWKFDFEDAQCEFQEVPLCGCEHDMQCYCVEAVELKRNGIQNG